MLYVVFVVTLLACAVSISQGITILKMAKDIKDFFGLDELPKEELKNDLNNNNKI